MFKSQIDSNRNRHRRHLHHLPLAEIHSQRCRDVHEESPGGKL